MPSRGRKTKKNEECNIHLYVITPRMNGVFSIAETVESAFIRHENCIFCYLEQDRELSFSKGQKKSLDAVGKLISKYGAYWAKSLDEIAQYINKY